MGLQYKEDERWKRGTELAPNRFGLEDVGVTRKVEKKSSENAEEHTVAD